jgi:hypothetical protein
MCATPTFGQRITGLGIPTATAAVLAGMFGRLARVLLADGSPRLALLATAAAAFAAAALLHPPVQEGRDDAAGGGLRALAGGLAAVAAMLLALPAAASAAAAPVVARLAVGVTVLTLLHGALAPLLAPRCAPSAQPKASGGALPALVLIAAAALAPVWLGPLLAATDASQTAIDATLAISPTTLLARLAGVDYLRIQWFYAYTPLGGMRFSYPPPTALAAAYFASSALLIAGRRALARTPAPGRSGTAKDPSEAPPATTPATRKDQP